MTIGGRRRGAAAGSESRCWGFGGGVSTLGAKHVFNINSSNERRKRVERRTIADRKWVLRFLGKKVGGTFPMLSPRFEKWGGGGGGAPLPPTDRRPWLGSFSIFIRRCLWLVYAVGWVPSSFLRPPPIDAHG